jgi:hypothetical protein
MRIRLHKILNEGRSVRFEKTDDEVLDLNVIVFREKTGSRQKSE